MVTNQMEGAFSAIPKGKREDSYEPLYRILQAPCFNRGKNYLGIRMSAPYL